MCRSKRCQEYYIPLCCYAHRPSKEDIYEYMLNSVLECGKVKVFSSYELAENECYRIQGDDEITDVLRLDFTKDILVGYFVWKDDNLIFADGDVMFFNIGIDEIKHIKIVK